MMNYQVLARKWRPKNFHEMVGQESILRMLSNAIDQQRLHHAYLFTGTRGVGKTTIARILAKCLNCETNISSKPCGTCNTCVAIDNGQFLDLYEVDAASRTKVEDTRDLLENVLYPPTQGRYKIYLIDEVHMLSNHSFNALLKTLEEPPSHVKFLLATTDPKRLPITILSRCLQFHLKRISQSQIQKHLQYICEQEKINFDIHALEKLSVASDGSMRDALSLLDQAIAYGQGKVNKEDVYAMLGTLAQEDILPLLNALAFKNGEKLFASIHDLCERAPDFSQILEEIIHHLHRIAVHQIAPFAITIDEALVQLAKQFSAEEVQLYYQMALLGRRDLAITPSPQKGFEMTILRMFAFTTQQDSPKKSNISSPPTAITKASNTPAPKSNTPAPATVATDWREILNHLGLTGMSQALAANCYLENINDAKIILMLSKKHEAMLNVKLKDRINEALNQYLKKKLLLEIKITTDEIVTPTKLNQQETSNKLQQTKETLLSDPKIQQLIEMYDATLDVTKVS